MDGIKRQQKWQNQAMNQSHQVQLCLSSTFNFLEKYWKLNRMWGAWVYVTQTGFNSWALKAQTYNEGWKNSNLTKKYLHTQMSYLKFSLKE